MLAPQAAPSPIVNHDPPLRLRAAAAYIGVSVKTVRRLIKAKRLKAVSLSDLVLGVRRSELERHLNGEPAPTKPVEKRRKPAAEARA
jgi:excisionase family DNA binding protein